jgi:hypothetical protein
VFIALSVFLSGCLTETSAGTATLSDSTRILSSFCDGDLNSVLATSGCVSINEFYKSGIAVETDPLSLHLTDTNSPSRFNYGVIANPPWLTSVAADTNWQTSYPVFDANMALRYYKQSDANNVFVKKSGDLMIGDLNLSTKTNTGMSIKSDKNRVCFQPNSCDYYVDWNGTDIIISWGA